MKVRSCCSRARSTSLHLLTSGSLVLYRWPVAFPPQKKNSQPNLLLHTDYVYPPLRLYSDFGKLSVSFVGAFYNFKRAYISSHNPFIVLVLKGTTPDGFSDWISDSECKLDSCGDFLGAGKAHEGFYKALFPSRKSCEQILPYGEFNSLPRLSVDITPIPTDTEEKS